MNANILALGEVANFVTVYFPLKIKVLVKPLLADSPFNYFKKFINPLCYILFSFQQG